MKFNKKFYATAFTLTGTIIGAGMLGLPYVFAKSGFIPGIIWIIIIGAIMLFVNLTLAEVTLRTPGRHQLTGYARKYLKPWARKIMFLAVAFGIYSALLAYLIGEADSFSQLIPLDINPIFYGIAFWLITTLMLREGLKELKRVETWGVLVIIIIVIGIFLTNISNIQITNLTTINTSNIFFPIGVVFFAMLGFASIPELRQEIKGQENKFKKAILLGYFIPTILYILFSLTFIGVLGSSITEVATLSFGPIITILGIFTMFTSYFVLSFALKDTLEYDLNLSKNKSFMMYSVLPLILYISAELFSMDSFARILGIGGTVSAGVSGIFIMLMAKKAKEKQPGKKTHINMPINMAIIITLSVIFILAIILELIH
jgi:tyrosine-specific transport protein